MEASKCPKCGEEPSFVEHLERWYCYECNTYLDGETDEAEEEHVEQAEHADAISEELRALEQERPSCKKCGAELEIIADGKLYCYVCESYPDGTSAAETAEVGPSAQTANEAQELLDIAASTSAGPKTSEQAVEIVALTVVPTAEMKARATEPAGSVPKEPEVMAETSVKMCVACGHPLKWIEKYSRHYCYGCKKYAPKEGSDRPAPPAPAKPAATKCPGCGGELKFIEKYKEHYCYECKKYPLIKKKPKQEERQKAETPATPAKQESLTCPKCGEALRLIEKYSRHYCYNCKEYAPKGYCGTGKSEEKKVCPACEGEMRFVSEYNEWYCYKCKKYSLRPSKPVLLF